MGSTAGQRRTSSNQLWVICLLVAPIAGFIAGGAADSEGEGPNGLTLILGIGVPAAVSLFAARRVGATWLRAAAWAGASVMATGLLLLLIMGFVFSVINPS